jgi:hypothetical protein
MAWPCGGEFGGGFGGGGGVGLIGGAAAATGGGGGNSGGGGGSYLSSLASDSILIGGEEYGFGLVTISIPGSSTWAMMLAGFAGLGLVSYRVSRKTVALAA